MEWCFIIPLKSSPNSKIIQNQSVVALLASSTEKNNQRQIQWLQYTLSKPGCSIEYYENIFRRLFQCLSNCIQFMDLWICLSTFVIYILLHIHDDFIRDYKLDHKWSLHSEWLRMQEMLMQQWQTNLVQKYA